MSEPLTASDDAWAEEAFRRSLEEYRDGCDGVESEIESLKSAVLSAALEYREAHQRWVAYPCDFDSTPIPPVRLAKQLDGALFNLLTATDALAEAMKK